MPTFNHMISGGHFHDFLWQDLLYISWEKEEKKTLHKISITQCVVMITAMSFLFIEYSNWWAHVLHDASRMIRTRGPPPPKCPDTHQYPQHGTWWDRWNKNPLTSPGGVRSPHFVAAPGTGRTPILPSLEHVSPGSQKHTTRTKILQHFSITSSLALRSFAAHWATEGKRELERVMTPIFFSTVFLC